MTELKVLDARPRGATYVAQPARSVLNPPAQTGMDFWSLNPYVGCEFGCTYCYARYTHRYVVERAHQAGKLDDEEFREYRGAQGWEAFERKIFVKEKLLEALERDLGRFFRAGGGETIVIGTATDPYQPAERRYRLTRAVLERLERYEGLSIGIITKSPLVVRDTDVLARLAARHDVEVHVSLTTVDPAVIRALEARSPLPSARLRALAALTAAGVPAGLIVAPVLPGITDGAAELDALFRAGRAAGARYVHASPLRLYAATRERFLPVLAAAYPALEARYRAAYERQSSAPRAYARALQRRIQRLQRKYGFGVNDGMRDRYRARSHRAQLELNV